MTAVCLTQNIADRGKAFIQTRSGRAFWPLDPKPEDIDIHDIAFSLAQQVRYAGHIDGYNVAQHSVVVSYHTSTKDRLWGLLHDLTEAYLGDVPSPIKRTPQMYEYRVAEARLMEAGCIRFGLPLSEPKSVKRADAAVLAAEIRDLMQPWIGRDDLSAPIADRIEVWSRHRSEWAFLKRYMELSGDQSVLYSPRMEELYRLVDLEEKFQQYIKGQS